MAAKTIKLPGAHQLIGQSFKYVSTHKKLLLGASFVGVIINFLLRFGGDEAGVLYQSIWLVFLLAALIWSIRHASDKRAKPTIRKAYFNGTAPVLKLLVVLFAISIASIPFSIGAFLYSAVGVVTAGSTSWWEQMIGVGLWSLCAIISVVFLTRIIFALIITTLPDMMPIQSLRASWHLSRSHVKTLLGRLLIPLLYILVLVVIFFFLLNLAGLQGSLAQFVSDVLGIGLLTPLLLTYIFKLYGHLQ